MADRHPTVWLDALVRDVRIGVRRLLRSPAVTIVALLTIAITTGGVATVFTLVNSVLLQPLPYPDADRLVRVVQSDPLLPFAGSTNVNEADLKDLRRDSQSLDAWGTYSRSFTTLTGRDSRVTVLTTTPALFSLFGMQTQLGHGLRPADAEPTRPRVAVVNTLFWRTYLDGRTPVLGEQISLDNPRDRPPYGAHSMWA